MLSAIKSITLQNPATISITAANVFVHIYIHKLNKKSQDDVSTTGYSFFEEKERVVRTIWTLFSHADDSHLLYNLLHMWMYLPLLENGMFPSSSSSSSSMQHQTTTTSSTSSSMMIMKKITATTGLYLLTGGCGVLTFLKGIQAKYEPFGETDPGLHMSSQFIPLIGNSPAAYGLHSLTMMMTLLSFSQQEKEYNRQFLPALFGLEAFLPPFLSLMNKQDMKQKMLNSRKQQQDGNPTKKKHPVSLSFRFKAFALAASAGLFQFFSMRKLLSSPALTDKVPPVSLTFLLYMQFRRFALRVFSQTAKRFCLPVDDGEANQQQKDDYDYDDAETSCDDHLGHLGGAVSGAIVGSLFLLFGAHVNKNGTHQKKNESLFASTSLSLLPILLTPALTLGELGWCVYQQMKN